MMSKTVHYKRFLLFLFAILLLSAVSCKEIREPSPEETGTETLREETEELRESETGKTETEAAESEMIETGETETEVTETEATETEPAETEATETEAEKTEATVIETTETPATAGRVKEMITLGLSYVSRSYGYSLYDRTGAGGHFDCSGFVAVLLKEGLNEQNIGWFGAEPWDTAYWRYFASLYQNGDRLRIGGTLYEVRMRESYDYEHAWEIPGSIVVQYPPENDETVKYGHISIALGRIPYESTEDVRKVLLQTYGVDLSGYTGNGQNVPMIYDPHGKDSGHTTWRINANGIANATCVDNNYTSDPNWIERIAAVFVPVE